AGRPRAASLSLPALGFLCRKLLLFVPVCGVVSTADSVVFWSGTAFLYFVVLVVVLPTFVLLFRLLVRWYLALPHYARGDAFPALLFSAAGFLALLWGGSWLLLPVDGLCHVYMPVVC